MHDSFKINEDSAQGTTNAAALQGQKTSQEGCFILFCVYLPFETRFLTFVLVLKPVEYSETNRKKEKEGKGKEATQLFVYLSNSQSAGCLLRPPAGASFPSMLG